jgi:hypothetical protein
MKAQPPTKDTRCYKEAFSALYATNPSYVATHLLSSEVVVSKEAEPFMISTTSRSAVEDEPVTESIGTLFFMSQSEVPHHGTRATLHLYHPSWHVHDEGFLREFNSLFDKKEIPGEVGNSPDLFEEDDQIITSASTRLPGEVLFTKPTPSTSHVSQYNAYVR